MSNKTKSLLSILLCFLLIFSQCLFQSSSANSSDLLPFIILSKYNTIIDIGDEFYVLAITSSGVIPSWKSSDSKVASVNTYGKVTAKKSGKATITAKIKNAEASCNVIVSKTEINISKVSVSIERGQSFSLSASTSNKSAVTWKSSKKSIATVNEEGTVIGIKPGDTTISATVDGSTATCKVKVKAPTVVLDKTNLTLYRGKTSKISASVSSGISPTWKTDKKSVAVVDEYGIVTAIKHGTATITANVDGVSKTCKVVVAQPVITLNKTEISMKKGSSIRLTAAVSSGNSPIWSSSNLNIAEVDSNGTITANKKGTAYIYAIEDGIKVHCIVHVTE